MELNKPVIQDLLRQLFAATVAADEARAQAFGHLDGLRDLIPEWIEKIACEGNGNGTVSLYVGDERVDLSQEDVETDRAFEGLVKALAPPWYAEEVIEAAKCLVFSGDRERERDLKRLKQTLELYLAAQKVRKHERGK